MLEYDLAHWMTILAAVLLLNVSPGPDIAFILGKAVTGGSRTGRLAMLGIRGGTMIHVILATAGLSAVLATSATAFTLVKWLGAAYLVWLGIQALRSKGVRFSPRPERLDRRVPGRPSARACWSRRSIPKWLCSFSLSCRSSWLSVPVQSGAQLAFHGMLIIAVAALIEPPLVFLAGRLTKWCRANTRVTLWLDRTLGGLLIALGTRLALSDDVYS